VVAMLVPIVTNVVIGIIIVLLRSTMMPLVVIYIMALFIVIFAGVNIRKQNNV
jgi:hypothetical protein